MSVPLPSPSPLSPSSAKPIPSRSRPTPISINSPHGTSPSSPGPAGGGATAASWKRPAGSSSVSRSFVTDDNWRERTAGSVGAGSFSGGIKSASGNGNGNGSGNGSAGLSGGKGPERTVGGFGFEKREVKSAGLSGSSGAAVSGLSREKDKKEKKEEDKDGDGKAAALSHVPCRFFKAGACTAGDSCPFSHAAPDSAKREVCQWFLKGNCKFGHKCALAHVRPGEPMSMDRKNKKAAQLEARERADSVGSNGLVSSPANGSAISSGRKIPSANEEHIASPVPIKSALSSSMQSPPAGRLPSSPLREPFGPPSGAQLNSPSAGFAHARAIPTFASSPSRPSPLSASFGANGSVPGPLSLKNSATNPLGSPLRPPVTAGAAVFSSSFSHASAGLDRAAQPVPLSASFAGDGAKLQKSIWARSDGPAEPLSPRRPIPRPSKSTADVFIDEEDHGEDFLPSSLSDLLTPQERARRMSRRDSQDSFSASPSHAAFVSPVWNGERLAQSAGPTMGPGGFLQSLWSAEGEDARKSRHGAEDDFAFGPATAQPQGQRTSLLTQQRSPTQTTPTSPIRNIPQNRGPTTGEPYLIRNLGDPSSPSSRALQEHAPGQSLPGGLASALSRLHLHGPRSPSGLGGALAAGVASGAGSKALGGIARSETSDNGETTPPHVGEHDEGLFAMDG
ncbi:hypothetical protein CI109_100892 [Kwoniella shandongensis]|uniref:Uncharacterized protein n=1 Tax=Kwoniella shandongensis TaxID=1734106 RepID=A0A5M6BU82_9TREE|nr:uncharacterized protein CI109_006145 [Kwoniella shandongensis]KAA5525572.1 hypothetical protein CI109_006145 [Kwoniella shandongensis]